MKARCVYLLLLVTVFLSACGGTFGSTQYIMPEKHKRELLRALDSVADRYFMEDKLAESQVAHTLASYFSGDSSFIALGARIHNERYVVDLTYRGTGMINEYKKLKDDLEAELKRIYTDSLKIETDQAKQFPIMLKSQTGEGAQ